VAARLTHFEELTSPAAGEPAGIPVALLPVGAVEPHGPHAPLGTDTLISLAVCERAAQLLQENAGLRPLILPAVAYGVTDSSAGFPGSVGVGAATLEAFVSDICRSLLAQGMEHRFIVNSHFEPAHVAALRSAADATDAVLFDVTRRRLAERLTAEFRSGAAHAGSYETSMVLALRPELVDAEVMRGLPELAVNMPAEMAEGKRSFPALGMHDAYCGNPAASSASDGEQTLHTLATLLVETIRERIST
jgi:creatinine amidohydrolase